MSPEPIRDPFTQSFRLLLQDVEQMKREIRELKSRVGHEYVPRVYRGSFAATASMSGTFAPLIAVEASIDPGDVVLVFAQVAGAGGSGEFLYYQLTALHPDGTIVTEPEQGFLGAEAGIDVSSSTSQLWVPEPMAGTIIYTLEGKEGAVSVGAAVVYELWTTLTVLVLPKVIGWPA